MFNQINVKQFGFELSGDASFATRQFNLKPGPDESEDILVSIDRSGDFKKWLND